MTTKDFKKAHIEKIAFDILNSTKSKMLIAGHDRYDENCIEFYTKNFVSFDFLHTKAVSFLKKDKFAVIGKYKNTQIVAFTKQGFEWFNEKINKNIPNQSPKY